ncbi:3-deoxy-manno-octulosonate cytidylyltransferase [Bdellovibrio sp. qaytius]|nr:3-deoxy-manno-octulosonate cytidylyltransferase [Bdellovibrio sp. qaytius]
MKIIAVIPARYASTRFPGKPLVKLKDKPLIQWVVEGAKSAKLVQEIYVATDDQRIADVVKACGGNVLMTRSECPTGTDRIFEATKDLQFDVVLNIQGDEPQITAEYIDLLAKAFLDQPGLDMATLAHPIALEDIENPNAVKVIKNANNEAIYFSRFAIPYSREKVGAQPVCEKHIGLYGYTKTFLNKFCNSEQSAIEKAESLEQLRALHLGAKIKVLSVKKPIQGVDTPEDLAKLETLLAKPKS